MRITHAIQYTVKANQLGGRAMIKGHTLTQKADSAPRGDVAEGLVQHPAVAGSGKHQPHGDMDGSSFTSAIWAKKAKDFATLHAQGKVLDRGHPVGVEEAAVLLADAVEFEGRVGHEALRIALAVVDDCDL